MFFLLYNVVYKIQSGMIMAYFTDIALFTLPAFQTEGKVYLILDFLRGGDLFTRLSKEVRHE